MKKQLHALKTMLVALFSVLCLTLSYSQAVEVDFDFTVTDANMTVQVGADVCPDCTPGDLLGAFFENDSGQLQCAGFQEWSGDQLAIAVMASESGLDNGMAAGETIQWVLYDAETDTDFLLDAVMNSDPPFSDVFIANGFGQILFPLEISSGSDCADDDAAMAPMDCATAVAVFGCDGSWNGMTVSDACQVTCDTCPADCADDDAAMAPMDCATAVAVFGCDGSWNEITVSDACQITCDACGGDSGPVLGCTDDTADNYNASATEDDGSCIFSGCMCELSFNYNELATIDDGSCVVLSGGCGDASAENYSGDDCADATYLAEDCSFGALPIPEDWTFTVTDANMTIQIGADVVTFNGSEPPLGSLLGVFFTNDAGELQCAGYQAWTGDQLAIAAMASESGLDNGFATGENFTWGLQIDGESFSADASSMNSTAPFSDTFIANGFGQLLNAEFSGEITLPVDGCTDNTACNFDGSATDDDGSCTYADAGLDCDGNCLADADGDGVCDDDEVAGCTDNTACNFDGSATDDDGSCSYANAGLDCDGNCLADADGDGICDGDEVAGCTDDTACNFDSSATDDDGLCSYANAGLDCDGNCLADADGDGICDGDEIAGCTNELAQNFNALATDDDGSCTFDCNIVDLQFEWDSYTYENAFNVNNLSGDNFISGNGSETDFTACLDPDIYVLGITDSFGDGVINGNVTILDNGTEVTYYPSSSFDGTWSETFIYFGIGGAEVVAGCMDDLALNYNEGANVDYLQECEYPAEPGPDWEVINTNPANTHIIGLMPGVDFSVDGAPLTVGSFIGVFYTDDNGNWACGGYTEWDGSTGVIVAQMNDETTEDIKDGFDEGEPLHFRVWSQDFVCEYNDASNAQYSAADWFFTSDDGNFQSNGISGLNGFDVSSLAISESHSDYTGYGVSCNGASDGSIDITISGGTAPFSYSWNTGESTEDLSDLGAGTYSVVVTDSNDCFVSIEVEITESEEMAISENHSDYSGYGVSCNGATDGSIDVTVTGGTGVYTYTWSNGATTEDIADLGAGTYSVVATDENGCSVSIEVEITETDEMLISESHSDYTGFGVSGSGATDGSIDVTVTGGTGVYTYAWSNGATTEDVADLGAGIYSVVVTDENGCSVSIEVEITEPVNMEITEVHSDFTGYGVSCNGAADGFIDVTVTGGTGVYTYAWSNGATTEDLADLSAGIYSVVATDENGNSVSIEVEITESEAMAISETHSDYSGYGVSCNGATDGSIDITVTGGTGVYTYSWSNGVTTEDLADLGAGTYSVFVTDENGCSVSIEVEITEADAMAISSTNSDYTGYGVSCNGATDGSIDVTVTGGTGIYTYSWSNADDEAMPVLWPESSNPLDLNNGLGTGGNATMMIDFTPDGVETGDILGMFYIGDGETGPTDAYTCAGFVTWDDSMPPAAMTILGNVSNGYGMEEGSPFVMFMYDSSTGETLSVENTWFTGGIMNDASAGYTNNGLYQTVGMSFSSMVNEMSSSEDLSDLGAGTYTLVATDENGCSVSIEVEITEADAMEISETHSDYTGYGVSCNGATDGSIDVTVTGGTGVYTYTWSQDGMMPVLWPESSNPLDLNNGLGTGGNATMMIDFTPDGVETGDILGMFYTGDGETGPTDAYTCAGFVTWDDSMPPAAMTILGNVSNGYGMEEGSPFVMFMYDSSTGETLSVENTWFTGGIMNDASAGYTNNGLYQTVGMSFEEYSSGASTEDISDLGAGTYTVVATDENGCSVSIEVEITESDEMLISETHSDYTGYGVSCNGATDGSIDVTVTGGTGVYTYTWSNGATTEDITDLGSGTYSVVATDENGCSVSIEVEITETEAMTISSANSDYTGYGVSCNGATDGFIDVTVTGGTGVYSYEWFTGGGDAAVNGFEGMFAPESWTMNLGTGNGSVLFSEDASSVTITGTNDQDNTEGGVTGNIDTNFGMNSPTEMYTVLDSDAIISFDWYAENNDGWSYEFAYYINGQPISLTDNDDGDFDAIMLNEPQSGTIEFSASAGDIIGFGEDSSDGCCGEGWLTISNFSVSTGASSASMAVNTEDISDLGAGTYTVVATDENGCSVSIEVEITESDEMLISETHSDYTGYGVSCNGATDGSIDVTVTGGTGVYTYTWSNGATTEDLADLGAGTYTVVATDENGCSVSIEVEITETEAMTISENHSDYSGYGVSCNGATDGSIDVTVTGGTGVYTYTWSNGATTEDISDLGAGTYSVVATDENGCSVSIEVEITEAEEMLISETHSDYTGYGVSCNGATDGSIDVTVTGGTGVYTYTWSNGATTEDISDLGAGTYSVVATDENGCSVSIEVEITEAETLELVVDTVTDGPHILGDIEEGFGSIAITVSGGTGVYTYEWTAPLSDGSTYTWINGDDIDGLFAGTYNVVATDENGCSVSSDITVDFYTPSAWDVDETDCAHIIEVPSDVNISIDDNPITYGDWISVSLGGDVVGMMMWNGEESSFTVFSDAAFTSDEFVWSIWNADEANVDLLGGDSDDAYYSAEALYDETYPNEGDFACDGLSRVLDVVARTIYIQQIDLEEGWGMYSTFISPDETNIESVMSEVTSNLTIMKDELGNVFWPLLGLNTIGDIIDGEGYSIKMAEGSMLEVSGDLIDPELELYMPSGWSFIGYLHQEGADASEMMAPVAEDMIIMKDGQGNVLWFDINVNTIGNGTGMMIPGQGFAIKMVESEGGFTYTYPSISEGARIASPSPVYALSHYQKSQNTGNNMTIGIPLEAWSVLPEIGDEIAAYNSKGILVGSVTYNGEATALTVWGDDITTEDKIEGLVEGEVINLEIWRKTENLVEDVKIDVWEIGNNIYSSNGIALAGNARMAGSLSAGFELYSNYPNPFDVQTTVSFFVPDNGKVRIGIYDMLGNLVDELANQTFEPGMYNLDFIANDIAQGTYFVRMEAEGTVLTKKIDLIK